MTPVKWIIAICITIVGTGIMGFMVISNNPKITKGKDYVIRKPATEMTMYTKYYNGHSYIVFEKLGYNARLSISVLHDPECQAKLHTK